MTMCKGFPQAIAWDANMLHDVIVTGCCLLNEAKGIKLIVENNRFN